MKTALALLMSAVTVAAATFAELPFTPYRTSSDAAWLHLSNDGWGYNLGADGDNLRSFGLDAGLLLEDRFYLQFNYSGLTNRGTCAADARRIDEMEFLAGGRFVHVADPDVAFSLIGGLGGLFYGNFSGLKVQEYAHHLFSSNPRPIPQVYDTASVEGAWFLRTDLYFPHAGIETGIYTLFTNKFDFRNTLSLGYWMVKPSMQVNLKAAYQTNHIVKAGSTARNVYNNESGLWLSSKAMVGPVVIERGVNVNSLDQFSYAGLRLLGESPTPEPTSSYRIGYSLGRGIGQNSLEELIRIYPYNELSRVAYFFNSSRMESKIGSVNADGLVTPLMKRSTDAVLGMEVYLGDPDVYHILNGFGFCGVGFSRQTISTCDAYQAQYIDTRTIPQAQAGGGVRIDIPDLTRDKPTRCLGLEFKAAVKYGFENSYTYTSRDVRLSWGLVFTEK